MGWERPSCRGFRNVSKTVQTIRNCLTSPKKNRSIVSSIDCWIVTVVRRLSVTYCSSSRCFPTAYPETLPHALLDPSDVLRGFSRSPSSCSSGPDMLTKVDWGMVLDALPGPFKKPIEIPFSTLQDAHQEKHHV